MSVLCAANVLLVGQGSFQRRKKRFACTGFSAGAGIVLLESDLIFMVFGCKGAPEEFLFFAKFFL